MKQLHIRFLVLGAGSLLAIAGVLAACGSDDTVVTSTVDGGSSDTGTNDSGSIDAAVDAGLDSGGDAGEAGLIDAGLTVASFTNDLAVAYCGSVARCCFQDPALDGGSPVDGGTYDQAKCLDRLKRTGFNGSQAGIINVDAGTLTLDQAKALDCVARLNAASCGVIGANDLAATTAACTGALFGKQSVGQECHDAMECLPGNFCNKHDADGGPGKCERLRGLDAGCGDTHNPALSTGAAALPAEQACSYRGTGAGDLHCEWFDFEGNNYKALADWKCAPAKANDFPCANDAWCSPGVCRNDTLKCASDDALFSQAACSTWVKP